MTEALEVYTYEDYLQWEGKWELIEGRPVAMAPAPVIRHQALSSMLIGELTRETLDCEGCLVVVEEDWKIDDLTVVKPDVALICDEPNPSHISKTPLIVAEILSPSTARRDERYKFELYESEKVPYYLLVYPDDLKAKIYKLVEGKYSKEGDFFEEHYRFDDLLCEVTVDFDRVFRKFRRRES